MTEREKWFEDQCDKALVSAYDITVFGNDYATNSDGNFLYSVRREDGSERMNYVCLEDLDPFAGGYGELLYDLMDELIEHYHDISRYYQKRTQKDARYIAAAFREALCRTGLFPKEYIEKVKKGHVLEVISPRVWNDENDMILGLWDGEQYELSERTFEEHDQEYVPVILPERLKKMGGYKFALKLTNMSEYLETYSNIQSKDQKKPFEVLAELEKRIQQLWDEKGEVRNNVLIDFAKESFVWFGFSHFEAELEEDVNFRTIYVCYYAI